MYQLSKFLFLFIFLGLGKCVNGKGKDSTQRLEIVYKIGGNIVESDKPFYFLMNGISFFGTNRNLYAGVNIYNHYNKKEYDWVGIGKYTYIRNNYIISPHYGYVFLPERKFNLVFQMNMQYARYRSLFQTNNETLKTYLVNNSYDRNRITFQLEMHYKIYKNSRIFLSGTFLSLKPEYTTLLLGIGAQFTLLKIKKI